VTVEDPDWVVVGRLGRAHGLRGAVAVEVRTDEPEVRFAPGAHVFPEQEPAQPLTVAHAWWHSGRLLVQFDGVVDRTAAQALRGTVVRVPVLPDERPADPEEFYDRHLLGMAVLDLRGVQLGTVREVIHLPGQDLLAVRPSPEAGAAEEVLVPFVAEIVVEVDPAAGLLRVDPPGGLFGPVPEDEESDHG
jgi:16S rRNA processing protein RimM